jgi:hypothetical protein
MNADQKRAAVPVAVIQGVAFVAGIVVSFSFTATHAESYAVGWKLTIGAAGPFMLVPSLASSLPLLGIVAGWLALCVWLVCRGIARGNRELGVMAAACLALTWVVGVFTTSMLTNLS